MRFLVVLLVVLLMGGLESVLQIHIDAFHESLGLGLLESHSVDFRNGKAAQKCSDGK